MVNIYGVIMKLVIDNITISGVKYNINAHDVAQIIKQKLLDSKLNFHLDPRDKVIVFGVVDGDKLFTSSVDNKVVMNTDDPRVKKLGRSYLNTKRLTKKQEDSMWKDAINKTLTDLGLFADIKLYEFEDDSSSFQLLRSGDDVKEWPLKSSAYPTQK